jgi:hypothetical protein
MNYCAITTKHGRKFRNNQGYPSSRTPVASYRWWTSTNLWMMADRFFERCFTGKERRDIERSTIVSQPSNKSGRDRLILIALYWKDYWKASELNRPFPSLWRSFDGCHCSVGSKGQMHIIPLYCVLCILCCSRSPNTLQLTMDYIVTTLVVFWPLGCNHIQASAPCLCILTSLVTSACTHGMHTRVTNVRMSLLLTLTSVEVGGVFCRKTETDAVRHWSRSRCWLLFRISLVRFNFQPWQDALSMLKWSRFCLCWIPHGCSSSSSAPPSVRQLWGSRLFHHWINLGDAF